MQYRKLGTTELEVSVIAIGGWAFGGDPEFWGTVDDNESIAAIQRALDLGINLIDTAAVYGRGRSESVVAKAVAGRREDVILATKCGLVWHDEHEEPTRCLKRDSILRECEASLRRLRTDTIDLYQVHWPDPDTPIAETMDALTQLREQGKIRAIGVSNFNCQQMSQARAHATLDCLQPKFSMLEPDARDDLIPYCQEYDIGVIAYSPLAQGLLTGKFGAENRPTDFRSRQALFAGETYDRNLAVVDRLRSIARELECTPAQLALRWVIEQPGVTAAIAGAKRTSQVDENARAAEVNLPTAVLETIDATLAERG